MFFGNVWQKIAQILLCVCIVSTLVNCQGVTGEAGGAVGENAGNIRDRERVCKATQDAFEADMTDDEDKLFTRWVEIVRPLRSWRGYLNKKPSTPHPSTICSGINTTCCKPAAEKEILHVTTLEYRKIYQKIMEEELATCPHIGRNFYPSHIRLVHLDYIEDCVTFKLAYQQLRAMNFVELRNWADAVYSTLTEIQRQLEIEVNQTLNNLLPKNTFQPLFDYFIQFLYTPDLCPLAGNIQSIIQELFKVVYEEQGGDEMNSNAVKLRCFRNASNSFTFLYLQDILTPLERQLHELKVFIESLKTAEEIMHAVRGHSFSDTCVHALMKLKYCAYCGGFTKFKPCLFFCLNTLRGCLADIAEISREFSPFLTALRKVSRDFPSNWQPEVFIANSLRNFATLSRTLKTTDLVSWVAGECGVPPVVQERQKRMSLEATSQLETVTPFTVGSEVTYNLLPNAIKKELDCMEKLKNLFSNIPEEMCYRSKQSDAIAHTTNDMCWTGSTLGRYEEPQVGISKAEQENNTAFQNLPFDPELRYGTEMSKLTQLTSQLNNTINQKLCFESDDEDCARRIRYVCDSTHFFPFDEGGSGSGNRSDTEDTATDADVPTGSVNDIRNRPNLWVQRQDDDPIIQQPDPYNASRIPEDQINSDSENDVSIEILDPEDTSPSTRATDAQPDQLIGTSSANTGSTLRIYVLFLFAYVVRLIAH